MEKMNNTSELVYGLKVVKLKGKNQNGKKFKCID